MQLTYNLSNFVGDGCTELTKSGLTYFGKSMVEKLNSLNMAVDVSHCSQQVGWDALEISTSPIIITHSNSNTIEISFPNTEAYEYSIGNEDGPFQTSTTFENVTSGFQDLYIRDLNQCAIIKTQIAIIGYDNFCKNVDLIKHIPCFLNAAFFVNAITNLHYTDSQLHMCISNLTHV